MLRFFKKEVKEPDVAVIRRGERAHELLQHPTFTESIEKVEEEIWRQFFNTTADSPQDREVLYSQITALHNIRNQLQAFVDQAKLTSHINQQKGRV